MGVDFAQAALAAGHNVVATGRNPGPVKSAVGEHERSLVAELDVTDAQSAGQAVAAAVERFGRIDVLVNNAVELADSDQPPLRSFAGEDAVEGIEQKARLLLAQIDAHRELSTSPRARRRARRRPSGRRPTRSRPQGHR